MQLAKNAKVTLREVARKESLSKRWEEGMKRFADELPEDYIDLCCLGLSDLVDRIVAHYDLVCVMALLRLFDTLIVTPRIGGLEAIPQIPEELAQDVQELSYFEKLPNISVSRDLVFPVEVGEFLTEHYDLTFPIDPSLEIVDKAYRDKALIKARKALTEFDKSVREGDVEGAGEKGRI